MTLPPNCQTSETDPLRIDAVAAPGGGLIGMTICPGKRDLRAMSGPAWRDLGKDLAVVAAWGAGVVVTLMEQHELDRVQAAAVGEATERLGMDWHHLPIVDVDVPDERFEAAWIYAGVRLRMALRQGGKILLHCRGGRGRTGMIAARLLVGLGMAPAEAVRAVRKSRPGTIETDEQEAHVRHCRPVAPAADARAARVLGCLLGGAVGDAFGYAIEFDRLEAIRRRHGPAGLREPVLHGGVLRVSDDTQMTLFTLEGLARGAGGTEDAAVVQVRLAYLDWLDTQRGGDPDGTLIGWLAQAPALRVRRAPGNTCLSALQAGGGGTLAAPINDSKGCGGAMRTAPVAFVPGLDSAGAFRLGARLGALTHGHPDGWGPSGLVPAIILRLLQGGTLASAAAGAIADLRAAREPSHAPYEQAIRLAGEPAADPAALVAQLGEGWTGEEAVAIALFAASRSGDFREVVAIAANHDGDSDSTASIAGQFCGAEHGLAGIPHRWVRRLDVLAVLLKALADPAWGLRASDQLPAANAGPGASG